MPAAGGFGPAKINSVSPESSSTSIQRSPVVVAPDGGAIKPIKNVLGGTVVSDAVNDNPPSPPPDPCMSCQSCPSQTPFQI